jgi:uncharacterized protein YcfJ
MNENVKRFAKENKLAIIGIAFGAIAGYIYWQQIGCAGGTCLIASKPINSTIYGAVMGGLLFSIFQNYNSSRL